MKSVLAVILFAASAFAQNTSLQAAPQGTCGPKGVDFDVKTVPGQAVPQLEDGKALVFVNEVFKKAPGELGNPTIRIGLDGKWLGAVRPNSYFSFSVDPGEHHLCTNWQSKFKGLSREAAFASFDAKAGRTYYFRARITYQGFDKAATMVLDLEPVNEDEGKYLVASSPASSVEAKR
jgi:hypothetical protein